MVIDAIRRFLELHRIGPARIVAACSGGIDSTALLLALAEMKRDILCGHVNHHLRGEESDGDEAFVRQLCLRINVPIDVRDGTLDGDAIRRSGLEAAAREVRHARLHEIREAAGASFIATAHQKNDQAETVVMRIMTGTGLAGLRAIHAVRADGIIRPLLDVTRDEILAFLAERGVTPRADRMNDDPRFLRNRVRAALREMGPDATHNIAAIAAQAQHLWPFVEQAIDHAGTIEASADATRFVEWPEDPWLRQAVLQRHIRRLDPHSRDVSARDLERLAAGIDTIKRVSVTKSLELIRRGGVLVLRRVPQPTEPFEVAVRAGQTVSIPQIGARLRVEGPDATFTVRNRRRGDRFGHKKLKDFLIDRKIAAEIRDRIPILVWNGRIIWVGVEDANRYKVTSPAGELFEVVLEHESQEEDQDGLQR
ncbi:MAG TPA: tRNA lysidine(34) synthetase TilS [Thermoanaerobaculia bacterium]|nr:tRNA lysidine(34) synthetase TilS [Thermoanaerobaculia bacterium]